MICQAVSASGYFRGSFSFLVAGGEIASGWNGTEHSAAIAFVAGAFGMGFLSVAASTDAFGGEGGTAAQGARAGGILLRAPVLALLVKAGADRDDPHQSFGSSW